tara:strand:+ start:3443 stop:4582 length:1140 start_codon:yes stop_codon:yes gene_type:complete
MKIALLLNTLAFGGAERVGSYILKYYNDNNKEIILILFTKNIKLDIPKDVKVFSLYKKNIYTNNLLNFLLLPVLSFRLSKILKKERIDFCLSLTSRPNYVNILSSIFFTNVKYAISERSCPSQEYSGYSMKSIINKQLIRLLYHRCEKVICNSIGNKNDLIKNFKIKNEKIKVINNPIDLELIKKIKKSDSFDTRFINFVSVGRLDLNKNFKMMINVFSKIRNNNVRLYIIGYGDEYKNLNDLIVSLGIDQKVFLIGEKSNPFQFLKSSDAFLFTSKSEGFPNVLIESLACKTFIISHNCMAGPDEILFDKVIKSNNILENNYGILTPFNDENKFLEGIENFIRKIDFHRLQKENNNCDRAHKYKLDKILKQLSVFIEE